MKITDQPPMHLTYCLNVHPGETWQENLAAIKTKAMAVREQVAPDTAFGLGLRLSCRAACELLDTPGQLDEFRQYLQRNRLYVFTINGFPYGQFHGSTVKENVYAPDWRDSRRLDYTWKLAQILDCLLEEEVSGSISTVPLSYKAWIAGEGDRRLMVENLAEMVCRLSKHPHLVTLALESEPDCLIESTAEVVEFFRQWTPAARDAIASKLSCGIAAAERLWRRHVGVCFDTAHAAVEFEDLPRSLEALAAAGIAVNKIQLSSALRLPCTGQALQQLRAFVDPVYLHQVKARDKCGQIISFPDLPQLLACERLAELDELRVHFHVPLFFESHGELASTSHLLAGRFAERLVAGASPHLEIETYTFDVLPAFLRNGQYRDIVNCIAAEFEWMKGILKYDQRRQ